VLAGDAAIGGLLGSGDGTFGPPIVTAIPAVGGAIVLEDFDEDRRPDVARSNDRFEEGWVGVLHGRCEQEAPRPGCLGDLNGDGTVDVVDLLQFIAIPDGPCPGCPEDLNGDGEISVLDLLQLLADTGPCP